MEKQKLYQEIRRIARSLKDENGTYTRADLAYDLKDFGVEKDSYEVGRLVWEAYSFYDEDAAIGGVFFNNEGKETLVSEFQVDSLIDGNDADALFPILQRKLDGSGDVLCSVEELLRTVLSSSGSVPGRSAVSTVIGAGGVASVQNEASALFGNYSRLVGMYEDARGQVKSVMEDFVSLRIQVCDIYRKYSAMLVDIFGDRIKAVSPELFDFNSVEWLDVQGMLQNVKLDFDRISEKCKLLMSDISDSFVNSLTAAGNAYKASGSKQLGLLEAGLKMVSHYIDAGAKTTELRQDFATLKGSVAHDVATIRGDMGRLQVIYKTMNDLYVPEADVFFRFAGSVLSGELQLLVDAFYSEDGIKDLKLQRDKLLEEYKAVEKSMTDEQLNIDYYTARIAENSQILDGMRGQYEEAKAGRPKKPFFLINILTLGNAGKKYNREIYDWHQVCAPVINKYEDLSADVKIDTDELKIMEEALRDDKRRHKDLKDRLGRMNETFMGKIRANRDVQERMLPHLEDMIKLLRKAREIAGAKLDARLMKTVRIEPEDMSLPQDVLQGISTVADAIRGSVSIDAGTVRSVVGTDEDDDGRDDGGDGGMSADGGMQEELAAIADEGNAAVQRTVDLLEEWGRLQEMEKRNAVAGKAYAKKLRRLQSEFSRNFADIDNKSAVLRASMARINTAATPEQLKEALLSLAGGNKKIFSGSDLDEFLNGNKTIEL